MSGDQQPDTKDTTDAATTATQAGSDQCPRAAMLVSCLALFTDMLVYGLAIPVLPLLPATVDAGPAATGALFASYALAMIAATPVAGRLVDRRAPPPRPPAGRSGRPRRGDPALRPRRAVRTAPARPRPPRPRSRHVLGRRAVPDRREAPPQTRGQAMGLAMSMVSVGVLVGPPLAGILVQALGTAAPFLLGAAVALADGIARLLLVRTSGPAIENVAGPVAVWRVPGTPSVLLVVLLGAASLAAIEPILPLHLTQLLGLQPATIGLLFALAVLTGAIASPLVGALVPRITSRALVATGGILAAAGIADLALSTHTWHVATALALLGGSNAFLLAPATTLIGYQGMRAHPPALGASYAVFNLAYAAGLFLGPLISGAITSTAGFPTALLVLTAAVVVATLSALPRLPTPRGMADAASRGRAV